MRNIILASVSILITAISSAASAETMYQPTQHWDEARVVQEQRQPMNMAMPAQQAPVANKPAPAATNDIMQFNFGM